MCDCFVRIRENTEGKPSDLDANRSDPEHPMHLRERMLASGSSSAIVSAEPSKYNA